MVFCFFVSCLSSNSSLPLNFLLCGLLSIQINFKPAWRYSMLRCWRRSQRLAAIVVAINCCSCDLDMRMSPPPSSSSLTQSLRFCRSLQQSRCWAAAAAAAAVCAAADRMMMMTMMCVTLHVRRPNTHHHTCPPAAAAVRVNFDTPPPPLLLSASAAAFFSAVNCWLIKHKKTVTGEVLCSIIVINRVFFGFSMTSSKHSFCDECNCSFLHGTKRLQII